MSEFIKITEETSTNTTSLALLFGLSARRIQQLTQDGVLQPFKRGEYLLVDTIKKYNAYCDSKKENLDDEDEKIEKAKRKAELQTKVARAQIAKAQADEISGKMHRAEDVEAATTDLCMAIRSALLALPGRLAIDVVGVSPAEASNIIRKEVYKIMDELSHYKYDPKSYEERVRDRMNWDTSQEVDNE